MTTVHNPYDGDVFFEKYSQMPRSQGGLAAAREWPYLRALLPDLQGKRVLDMGCGYGWHCRYAAEQGAQLVLGVDISQKMLAQARAINSAPYVQYRCMPIEDIDFAPGSFDVVLSSLALHYIDDVQAVCSRVHTMLTPGGAFVFSVEHPIFTAQGRQQWLVDARGERVCWPVDRYFESGRRDALFLGEEVPKYHRTMQGYIDPLLTCGFTLSALNEAPPPADYIQAHPDAADELRRPMFLLLAAHR